MFLNNLIEAFVEMVYIKYQSEAYGLKNCKGCEEYTIEKARELAIQIDQLNYCTTFKCLPTND